MTSNSMTTPATTQTAGRLFCLAEGVNFYLASESPRRVDFLRQWGLPFSVLRPHGVEPPPVQGLEAGEYAMQAARAKARAAWHALENIQDANAGNSVVLAADTIVSIDGRMLGKPCGRDESRAMLAMLAGRTHHVTTAVCILYGCAGDDIAKVGESSFRDVASVTFHDWPESLLAAYADTDEPYDKAGGYAIQGQGAFLVERIDGAWSTVVGLPMTLLAQTLLGLGIIRPGNAND